MDITIKSINKQLKKDFKVYKNCWFVPIMMHLRSLLEAGDELNCKNLIVIMEDYEKKENVK